MTIIIFQLLLEIDKTDCTCALFSSMTETLWNSRLVHDLRKYKLFIEKTKI